MSDHPRQVRVVDVFTEKALAGNQLAVVLDGRDMSAELMQSIAREMNFSETTFILPPVDPSHAARVRIFTPFMELPFAGHPTIGTAWVLHAEGLVKSAEFVLEENVGPVKVHGVDGVWWMDHPALTFGDVFAHKQVASTIGIAEDWIIHDVPAQIASTGTGFLFVAVRDAGAVDAGTPDPARVRKLLRRSGAHGVVVFTAGGNGRLYARMFGEDVPEDPATGSAAGPLGAFAVRYGLVPRAPRVSIVSEQGTKMGRQSFLRIELEYGDTNSKEIPTRIQVGGGVMPVLTGTLADFGR
ncbi:MAG TPA: PhzF family phenazine biosynthesis protein [Candidatus Dormibacteraeota bacterium]|nr:PhzF family phenazine biosynthesis protein [Candidatus Dormibacteraeota bacterium]